ncbi:MAG: restriction endonuclease subunit S [Pelovirga sp.]
MTAGWLEMPLGEVLRLEYGKPLERLDRRSDGKYPVYGANGEKDRSDRFYHDKPSIIVGRKGSAGEINLTEKKFWPLDVTYFVTFDEQKNNLRFLYFLLSTLDLPSLAKGVKPGINRNEVYSTRVRIPPLPEQQRIVAILDQAFDGIATAKANAEKNLKNAREIFESHLNTVFTQRGEGWVERKLENLCRFVRGPFGGSLKKTTFVSEGYAVYEQQHAIYDQFTKVRYFIDEKKFQEMKRFELSPGDLIMSCSGTMGRVAIVPNNIQPGIINQALLKLSPTEKILNSFLKAWMDSNCFQESIKNHSGGAAIQNVASVKILKEIRVPLPSVAEQKKAMDRITEMQITTQHLESIYQQKLAALDELKKSLLHQAFTGELTTSPDKQLDEALT